MYPGGYIVVDLGGVILNADSAVTIDNASVAEILRATNKPVHIHNAVIGAMAISAQSVSCSDTGARDGKVHYFNIQGKVFTVSTDDNNITFTPA